MQFTKHPILDLEVNEDGSVMIYKGKPLNILEYKLKHKNYSEYRVNFMNRSHHLPKLVCEAWNGMRDNPEQVVQRRDLDPGNNHYTNLYWSDRHGNLTTRKKRDKRSKVKKDEIPKVIDRLEHGETLRNIARSYNTSDMAIHRIKRRFITNHLMVLRERIMQATTPHARQAAYAKYMGYKNLTEAIAELGSRQFKSRINELSTKL